MMTRLRRGDGGLAAAAVAGIALVASLFAPFYWTPVGTIPAPGTVEGFDVVATSVNAWAAFAMVDVAVAACGVISAVLAVAIVRGAADRDAVPAVQVFGALAFVLVGYRLAVQMEPAELVSVRWGFGLALPLALAIVLAPLSGTEMMPTGYACRDAATLLGSALLFAALFAPWYAVDAAIAGDGPESEILRQFGGLFRRNAFEALRVIDVALVLIALAAAGFTVATLLRVVPGRHAWIVPALGVVAIVLVAFRLAVPPGGFERSWGGYLALAGAVAITAGAIAGPGGWPGTVPAMRRA